MSRAGLRLAAAAIFAAVFACSAGASAEVTFRIEFNDGQVTPQRLEVPANRRLELELVNKG